jgi:hypothetical protein
MTALVSCVCHRSVGDSRAVVGAMKGSKILALDLSQDQCCANASERERIKAAGGEGSTPLLGSSDSVLIPFQGRWQTSEALHGLSHQIRTPSSPRPGALETASLIV